MKKILFLFFAFLFICSSTFALTVDYESCSSLGGIVLPGTSKEMCFKFSNPNQENVSLVYNFPFGDPSGQGCNAGNGFSDVFFGGASGEMQLKSLETKQLRIPLHVSVGMSGLQRGCINYTVNSLSSSASNIIANGTFQTVLSYMQPFSFFVGGDADIKNKISVVQSSGGVFSTSKDVSFHLGSLNDGIVHVLVQNKGNVKQSVSLFSGVVSNFLGFNSVLSPVSVEIYPGSIYDFSLPVSMLPSYKGLFDIQLSLVATPVFAFDVSSLDKKHLEPTRISLSSTVFVFSWVWVVAPLLIIFVLLKMFWPRKVKEVVVQNSGTSLV